MRPLFALAFVLALPACETFSRSDPSVTSLTPTGMTIRHREGGLDAATQRANELCASYGKAARLDTVAPADRDERLAQYSCI